MSAILHPGRDGAPVPGAHRLPEKGLFFRIGDGLRDAPQQQIVGRHRRGDALQKIVQPLAKLQGLRQALDTPIRFPGEVQAFQGGAADILGAHTIQSFLETDARAVGPSGLLWKDEGHRYPCAVEWDDYSTT